MKKFFQEFKEFAIGGNLIDMAVGVIVGGAFNAIVGSLVKDVFTPLIGMIFGSQVDFSELMIGQIAIGNFINAVVTFLLTALCLFILIKSINKAKAAMKKEEQAPAPEPAAEPEPSDEAKLLAQIVELLQKEK